MEPKLAINVGFTVLFAPLLCKTYRVDKVMNNKALRKVQMSNREVMSMVAGFVLIEVGILVVWQIVDPVKKVVAAASSAAIVGVDALAGGGVPPPPSVPAKTVAASSARSS